MITSWVAIRRVVVTGAERLYPQGLDWALAGGINAVVGGTGLGKTTLLYAVQFTIFGKLVIDAGERIEREFFKDRLTERKGSELDASPPVACVEFLVGKDEIVVERELLTGSIRSVTLNKDPIRGNKYEELLAAKLSDGVDFASLGRLQGHLLFFGEGRRLLAWESDAARADQSAAFGPSNLRATAQSLGLGRVRR